MFTWRLYYGTARNEASPSEQIAAFAFYRWWTMPFDIFCMIVLIFAILYSFLEDVAGAKAGRFGRAPDRRAESDP